MTEIVAALNQLFYAAYGQDADLDPRSPDGQIIGGIAEMFDDLNGLAFDLWQSLANPNAAKGSFLSGMAYLTGIARNHASYSTAPATFTGTSGTVIPTTAVVKSTLDQTLWSPTTAITIGSGGTASGTLKCSTIGPPASGNVPAGSLTQIMTPITSPGDGWVSVINSVGVSGYLQEGDTNLRVRRQQSVAIASQNMTDGLQAALQSMQTEGVHQAVVWENDGDNPVAMNGGIIPPHSVYVVCAVEPGSDADPELPHATDLIANKILLLKSGGCSTAGRRTKTAIDDQGHPHVIHYDDAEAVRVLVRIAIVKRASWQLDGADRIKAAIATWVAGTNADTGKPNIQIGGDGNGNLSWTDVLASFINTVAGFNFTSMQFSIDAGSTWLANGANVPIDFNKLASIVSGDIQVTVS
jgi:hypothetical protein